MTARLLSAAATASIYLLDRGGVSNQLSENPDFNGSANYSDAPSQGGWQLDFTGSAPACASVDSHGNTINCNEALPGTQGALPLPIFGSTVMGTVYLLQSCFTARDWFSGPPWRSPTDFPAFRGRIASDFK